MPDLTSDRFTRLTQLANKEAMKSDGKHRHGAVAIASSRVLAKGHNSYHTGKHAEVAALCRVPYESRKGCSIIVVRPMRRGSFGNSKPCPECQEFLQSQGVVAVYFTNDEGHLEEFEIPALDS